MLKLIAILAIALLLIFWANSLAYRKAQRYAFNRLFRNLHHCQSIRQLRVYDSELAAFKKHFTDDEQGTKFWVALNEMYDSTERSFVGIN